MIKDKDKQPDSRDIIAAIAAAVMKELTPAVSEDDADAQELFRNPTKQAALSAVLGKPVPGDDEPPKRDGFEGAVDEFARDVNRNARFNGEVAFDDTSTEAILQKLVDAVMARRKGI